MHGTDQQGFEGLGGLEDGKIDVTRRPGEHQDFGRGFYEKVCVRSFSQLGCAAYALKRHVTLFIRQLSQLDAFVQIALD